MKRIIFFVSLLLTAAVIFSFAAGDSESESLISLSYLNEIFTSVFENQAQVMATGVKTDALSLADNSLNNFSETAQSRLDSAFAQKISEKAAQRIKDDPEIMKASGKTLSLKKGDVVCGKPGAGIILLSGEGKVSKNSILNVTVGATREPGAEIKTGIYYMVLENDGSGIEITSDGASALVLDGAGTNNYKPLYTDKADKLRDAGLFKGTNHGYELERAPTRQEALIMLIRLLGEETQALAFDETQMTFKDVTGWLDGRKYVAYGAAKKYTNGRSADVFDPLSFADENMYLTFVLRALGYSDEKGDFVWNTTSKELAVSLGLLTQEQLDGIKKTGFKRDHVVLISLNALSKNIKGENITLAQKLQNAGAISAEQAKNLLA